MAAYSREVAMEDRICIISKLFTKSPKPGDRSYWLGWCVTWKGLRGGEGKGGRNRFEKDAKNASPISGLFNWMPFILTEKNEMG